MITYKDKYIKYKKKYLRLKYGGSGSLKETKKGVEAAKEAVEAAKEAVEAAKEAEKIILKKVEQKTSKKVEEIMSKNKANLTQEEKAAKAKVEAANVEEKKIISNFEALKSYYKKKLDEKKMNITDEKKVEELPEYHKNKAVNNIINYYMKPKKLVKFPNDVYKEIHEFKKYNEDKERYNDIEKKDYKNLLINILLNYPYLTMIERKNLSEEDIKNIFNP